MTTFGTDDLTLVSDKLIHLPALCVQCGDPTDKTTSVTINIHRSPLITFVYFLPIPFKEFLVLAMEAGSGPNSTRLPHCKICRSPRNLAGLGAVALILFIFAVAYAFTTIPSGFPFWVIGLGLCLAVAALVWSLWCIKKYQDSFPVKISRGKDGNYRYEFRSGIYTTYARREGITHADLTSPPSPGVAGEAGFPGPLDFTK